MSETDDAQAQMTQVVVCVDDTDDLSKETSTGAVAEAIAREAQARGGIIDLGITRHQLLLDERVPYTSHNSSMAFTAHLPHGEFEGFADAARQIVWDMRAATSDPGLCIGSAPDGPDAALDVLVSYGFRAQREVIEKSEALALAERIPWLSLWDLGGTGAGVIGALAGVGLRLSGGDGRFRGKWNLVDLAREAGLGDATLTVGQTRALIEERVAGPVSVVGPGGEPLDDGLFFTPGSEVKPLLRAGGLLIVGTRRGDIVKPFSKGDLEALGEGRSVEGVVCPSFAPDNDCEEFAGAEGVASCANCLYRRLTATGFSCMRVWGFKPRQEVHA